MTKQNTSESPPKGIAVTLASAIADEILAGNADVDGGRGRLADLLMTLSGITGRVVAVAAAGDPVAAVRIHAMTLATAERSLILALPDVALFAAMSELGRAAGAKTAQH